LLAQKGLGLCGSQLCVCLSDVVVCVGLCGCVRRRCSSRCRAQVSYAAPLCVSHNPLQVSALLTTPCLSPPPASSSDPFSSPGPTLHAELPLLELADSKHRVGAARAYLSDYFAGALVESQVGGRFPPFPPPFTHITHSSPPCHPAALSHLAPSPRSLTSLPHLAPWSVPTWLPNTLLQGYLDDTDTDSADAGQPHQPLGLGIDLSTPAAATAGPAAPPAAAGGSSSGSGGRGRVRAPLSDNMDYELLVR